MTPSLLRTAAPLTLALALIATTAAAAATPLGNWMNANMVSAITDADFPALQKNFDLLATKQPAGYADWARNAKAGSAAAAKHDTAGVKAACAGCHSLYKKKYQKEFVTTPFP